MVVYRKVYHREVQTKRSMDLLKFTPPHSTLTSNSVGEGVGVSISRNSFTSVPPFLKNWTACVVFGIEEVIIVRARSVRARTGVVRGRVGNRLEKIYNALSRDMCRRFASAFRVRVGVSGYRGGSRWRTPECATSIYCSGCDVRCL